MTILSKKKTNASKDRREGSNNSEVDVHGVQNEHNSTSIALPNTPYQVWIMTFIMLFLCCILTGI